MNHDSLPDTPAREFYTAQELADLALEWGDCVTLNDDDGAVTIQLDRPDSIMCLDLGPASQFYTDVLCRTVIFVPSAPHRFCDQWNEFPYYGAFSVVYGENDFPHRSEAGFAVRAVKVVEFEACRRQHDIFIGIMTFWYAIDLIQNGVINGETDFRQLKASHEEGGFTRWLLGSDDPD